MKLLIVAGPYEADRLRKAAVSGGFEAVAVEPGESLSGWITATRPDVIILAPQIVNPDPAVALAKVRAVPRGRVPIFLVGEEEERALFQPLADGFFVRPVAPEDLLAKARDAMAHAAPRAKDDSGSGPHGSAIPLGVDESGKIDAAAAPKGGASARTPTLKPLIAAREPDGAASGVVFSGGGEGPARIKSPPPKDQSPRALAPTAPSRKPTMFDLLSETIDAVFDAEIREVVRAVGVLRPSNSLESGPAARAEFRADPVLQESQDAQDGEDVEELKDESSQKTLEVPPVLSAALVEGDRREPSEVSEPRSEQRTEAVDRALVQSRHALVVDGDYFQILGVARDASAQEIIRAHEALVAELAPEVLHPSVTAQFEGELSELRLILEEAARLLGDDRLRRQYRDHLPRHASATPTGDGSP